MPLGYGGVQPVTINYGGSVSAGDSGGKNCYGDSSLFSTNNNSQQEKQFWSSYSSLDEDYGLLQDMMSSHMRRDLIGNPDFCATKLSSFTDTDSGAEIVGDSNLTSMPQI
ncbi:hypothetical protein CQW23_12905 [Capsicum baccatum]|uniref:Uncharacterized protein n=1 Tax=Capsicum baccatum TaxID=33114 RepID=A0A2G2WTX6_CAPBA|nr:hypothetical protein CQW23_12905 [Capsicum baccatum]